MSSRRVAWLCLGACRPLFVPSRPRGRAPFHHPRCSACTQFSHRAHTTHANTGKRVGTICSLLFRVFCLRGACAGPSVWFGCKARRAEERRGEERRAGQGRPAPRTAERRGRCANGGDHGQATNAKRVGRQTRGRGHRASWRWTVCPRQPHAPWQLAQNGQGRGGGGALCGGAPSCAPLPFRSFPSSLSLLLRASRFPFPFLFASALLCSAHQGTTHVAVQTDRGNTT
jgi:hypothetical protein